MEDLFRARNCLLDGDRVRDRALHHPELRLARKQSRGLPLAAGEVVEPEYLVASPQQFLRDMTADEPRCARDADLRHPSIPSPPWNRSRARRSRLGERERDPASRLPLRGRQFRAVAGVRVDLVLTVGLVLRRYREDRLRILRPAIALRPRAVVG